MITIAWYNAVAIAVGLLAAFLIWKNDRIARRSFGYAGGLVEMFNIVAIFVLAVLFYALWGGIFWW